MGEEKEKPGKAEGLKITLPQKKLLWKLAILLIAGVCFMAIAANWQTPKATSTVNTMPSAADSSSTSFPEEEALATKIATVLEGMVGVGQVQVSVTFAQSGQAEYASDKNHVTRTIEEQGEEGTVSLTNETTESSTLVLAENGGQPVLTSQEMPEIQGVLVVAEGAEQVAVKEALSQAVEGLLGISPHRIVIMPGKGK